MVRTPEMSPTGMASARLIAELPTVSPAATAIAAKVLDIITSNRGLVCSVSCRFDWQVTINHSLQIFGSNGKDFPEYSRNGPMIWPSRRLAICSRLTVSHSFFVPNDPRCWLALFLKVSNQHRWTASAATFSATSPWKSCCARRFVVISPYRLSASRRVRKPSVAFI